jgi:hypothetical protein
MSDFGLLEKSLNGGGTDLKVEYNDDTSPLRFGVSTKNSDSSNLHVFAENNTIQSCTLQKSEALSENTRINRNVSEDENTTYFCTELDKIKEIYTKLSSQD